MKTVIMAGGKGTRISDLFPKVPKPLIPIKTIDREQKKIVSKPVLQWEIEKLREQGFIDIILTLSYKAEQIQDYFSDGSKFGVHIQYFVEESPLGNAGALFKMREMFANEPFLLLNADAIFEIDFNRMVEFHMVKKALVTLFTHPNSHPYDSGIVIADNDKSVKAWLTKEEPRPLYYKNRVNAGLHVIDPQILDLSGIDSECVGKKDRNGNIFKVDLDRMLLKPLCGTGKMYCYDSPEYVKDMGTPERYEQVLCDLQRGIISSKNLKYKQKAIFLDRDGTINKYVGFLREIDKFELLPGVIEGIRIINESGYLAIVVTNQPVIARGEVTIQDLERIHEKMETELGRYGAYIDGLYYCPHHPHGGYEGEIPELKVNCECRKPKPGMLVRASQDFNIDLTKSWIIGDGNNDIKAGKNAGCHTALIGYEDYGQEISASNLLEAVKHIIS